jgi:hypothetical protein
LNQAPPPARQRMLAAPSSLGLASTAEARQANTHRFRYLHQRRIGGRGRERGCGGYAPRVPVPRLRVRARIRALKAPAHWPQRALALMGTDRIHAGISRWSVSACPHQHRKLSSHRGTSIQCTSMLFFVKLFKVSSPTHSAAAIWARACGKTERLRVIGDHRYG